MMATNKKTDEKQEKIQQENLPLAAPQPVRPWETGGPAGLEPTRYGDWEKKGRCIDF